MCYSFMGSWDIFHVCIWETAHRQCLGMSPLPEESQLVTAQGSILIAFHFAHNLTPPVETACFFLKDSDWSGHILTRNK